LKDLSIHNHLFSWEWHTRAERRTSSMKGWRYFVSRWFFLLLLLFLLPLLFKLPFLWCHYFANNCCFSLIALVLFLIAIQILAARSTTHFTFASGIKNTVRKKSASIRIWQRITIKQHMKHVMKVNRTDHLSSTILLP
jgi:hypothetical protein